jgi:hypothetical protein
MPAGMYRRLLSEDRNPHPTLITKDGSYQSSRQITDYVFCQECESRFDKGGENYTLRSAAGNGRFRLLEELQASRASYSSLEWVGYNVSDTPRIKRDQLAYFALSVFWRASVHTWPSTTREGKATRIYLGRENNEELRRYLLGQRGLPSTVSLFFVVLTDTLSQSSFYMPSMSHKRDFCWTYVFFACGLLFLFTVGKRLTQANIGISVIGSPEQWIWVRDGEAKTLEAFMSLVARQPPEVRLK